MAIQTDKPELTSDQAPSPKRPFPILDILLLLVFLAGAYFRFMNMDWDQGEYLHPDERFLAQVESEIQPVGSISEYFNTETSVLNPTNYPNYRFFVYGTFPIFLVRYVGEWVGQIGYGDIRFVGRPLSATFDLMTVGLVYLIATRLFKRRVGVLAAAFYAFAVLPIQLSHFFKEDTFMTFFAVLAVYYAVRIATGKPKESEPPAMSPPADEEAEIAAGTESEGEALLPVEFQEVFDKFRRIFDLPFLLDSIMFGVALGMAVASKINAAPVAITLPIAVYVRLYLVSHPDRKTRWTEGVGYLFVAAFTSLLIFRIAQPYAFAGPGFFGLKLNPVWIESLKTLAGQNQPGGWFPPSVQWENRPFWFSGQNMITWGLGLPLGILAWVGFLWAGWRILLGEKKHLVLWSWTALYFLWQSSLFNPTMRYQMPIYPLLAVFAAWAVFSVARLNVQRENVKRLVQILAGVVGAGVLLATFAYAFAFTRIYTRPITRIEATQWIYENVPAAINLHLQTEENLHKQLVTINSSTLIRTDDPYDTIFEAEKTGEVKEVYLAHVVDRSEGEGLKVLQVTISSSLEDSTPLGTATVESEFSSLENPIGSGYYFTFDEPIQLLEGEKYVIVFTLLSEDGEIKITDSATINIQLQTDEGYYQQLVPFRSSSLIRTGDPFDNIFVARMTGEVTEVYLPHVVDQSGWSDLKTLQLAISRSLDDQTPLGSATVKSEFSNSESPLGSGYTFTFDEPVQLIEGERYVIIISLESVHGVIDITGSAAAQQTAWDDPLPRRMFEYDGFGGLYAGDLGFEMYWPDDTNKLVIFLDNLDKADYVYISSSRQWGSTSRLPDRYALNIAYYRSLIGCPEDKEIEWCYNVAEPGDFQGDLGFELIQTFTSHPSIGPFEINDQFSEEAFTVYDHPKVFIFQKTDDYDPVYVRALLGAVDLSGDAAEEAPDLLLTPDRLAEQRAGGTWSELFNPNAIFNSFQPLGVIFWYLCVALLGLIAYPLVRLAFPGLSDRGYPLARTVGLLTLSYFSWLSGSVGLTFSRLAIAVVLGIMIVVSALLAYWQRNELAQEWKEKKRYFLMIEGLMLAFFLFNLLVRLGNPDLWHPWKGGEKPMDFAYFNAVLKSTSFPPFDPWFSGGYIHYYYYGFVFVGALVKLLGFVPAFAYNLILPTLFMMIAMGAFSVAWNLFQAAFPRVPDPEDESGDAPPVRRVAPWLVGLSGALGMAVLGNLGTVKMILDGYQKLGLPEGMALGDGNVFSRAIWTLRGLFEALANGAKLPYATADWYWNPSRIIPSMPGDTQPITEFPYFTVIYADPHAHLYALPIALVALAWALSVALARGRWRGWVGTLSGFLIGGMAIGVLRPTNTWDMPTYLGLGVVALGYALWRNYDRIKSSWLSVFPAAVRRLLVVAGGVAGLVALSIALFQPYAAWYSRSVGVRPWFKFHTPIGAYLGHWGLFLFVLVSWMLWETRQWLAATPLSALRKLEPYKGFILAVVVLLLAATFLMAFVGLPTFGEVVDPSVDTVIGPAPIFLIALPLAAWAGVLLLRPGIPEAKRFVLFLVGTGLTLTMMVEVVTLADDVGRMNTVFKFYLQTWTLFAVSSAAGLGWLLSEMPQWLPRWRNAWRVALAFLVACTALFPLTATYAKIVDRVWADAPLTLDGMAYMINGITHDYDAQLDLIQDYYAIRWVQDNVIGSPVFVEATTGEYHWGSRFAIYTGNPSVIGWNWHQRQQRTNPIAHTWITDRWGTEVPEFYQTESAEAARAFLDKYEVSYIVLGQLERAAYPGPGLDKFEALDGILWREVFRYGDMVIYEVIR